VAGDVGPDHCFPGESDDSFDCELPPVGTTANVTKTPTSITLYAGLFADAGQPVTATLTGYRGDGTVAAQASAPIGVGVTTPITITDATPEIVKWSLGDDVQSTELGSARRG
jgi:hypothetical protein